MYAVIEAKGHQYLVQQGDRLRIPKLNAESGDSVSFKRVLFISGDGKGARIGKPTIENASVEAEVVANVKEKKVIAFKKKRRHGFHKKKGHRTQSTEIKILSIKG